jgi:hypothetical protein
VSDIAGRFSLDEERITIPRSDEKRTFATKIEIPDESALSSDYAMKRTAMRFFSGHESVTPKNLRLPTGSNLALAARIVVIALMPLRLISIMFVGPNDEM